MPVLVVPIMRKAVNRVSIKRYYNEQAISMSRVYRQMIECLRRQLSVSMACDAAGGVTLIRQQRAVRNALMGLGAVATLCGDDNGGCALYERASQHCR